jgi:hypothetical protein
MPTGLGALGVMTVVISVWLSLLAVVTASTTPGEPRLFVAGGLRAPGRDRYHDNMLMCSGGFTTNSTVTTASTEFFNFTSNTWQAGPNMLTARAAACSVTDYVRFPGTRMRERAIQRNRRAFPEHAAAGDDCRANLGDWWLHVLGIDSHRNLRVSLRRLSCTIVNMSLTRCRHQRRRRVGIRSIAERRATLVCGCAPLLGWLVHLRGWRDWQWRKRTFLGRVHGVR